MENPAEGSTPRLYTDLTDWWHTLSSPAEYDDEASFIAETVRAACQPQTLLELGCGGGNNAYHLKNHFNLTLVDQSPGMLAASQRINPECEHVLGDMRTLQLGRRFDAILIHDAIVYMTTRADLVRAIQTAALHCRSGGAVIVMPDFVRENFVPKTEHGGSDNADRSARYLSWTFDPDPTDEWYVMDFAYLLRSGSDEVQSIYDRHICGIFSIKTWLEILQVCGFEPRALEDNSGRVIFLGEKQ